VKYNLLIICCFLICLCSYSQNKYTIEIESNYIHQPFNQFNLVESGIGYFDINIKNQPAFSFGLGIKRMYKNHTFGVKYRYFVSGVEIDFQVKDPNEGIVFEENRSFVFDNSSVLGFNYTYLLGNFRIGASINLLAFQNTRNNIFDNPSIGYEAVSQAFGNNGQERFSVGKREQFNLNSFKRIRVVPEINIDYRIFDHFYLNAGVFLQFWGNGTAYSLLLEGNDTTDENLPEQEKDILFNNVELKNRLVAPHIGISYNFEFGK